MLPNEERTHRRSQCLGIQWDAGSFKNEHRAKRDARLYVRTAKRDARPRLAPCRRGSRRGRRARAGSDLRDRPREVFALLLLDNQHRVIQFVELFYGTIDAASVWPREIVQIALKHNAAAVILAHNHPSGVAEPSRADRQITDRITAALALIDIRVLDHLVIGDGITVSFAERGWL